MHPEKQLDVERHVRLYRFGQRGRQLAALVVAATGATFSIQSARGRIFPPNGMPADATLGRALGEHGVMALCFCIGLVVVAFAVRSLLRARRALSPEAIAALREWLAADDLPPYR